MLRGGNNRLKKNNNNNPKSPTEKVILSEEPAPSSVPQRPEGSAARRCLMMGRTPFPSERQPKRSLLSSDVSNLRLPAGAFCSLCPACPACTPARHPQPRITLTRARCDGSPSSVLSAAAQSHRAALPRWLQDTARLWHEGRVVGGRCPRGTVLQGEGLERDRAPSPGYAEAIPTASPAGEHALS